MKINRKEQHYLSSRFRKRAIGDKNMWISRRLWKFLDQNRSDIHPHTLLDVAMDHNFNHAKLETHEFTNITELPQKLKQINRDITKAECRIMS